MDEQPLETPYTEAPEFPGPTRQPPEQKSRTGLIVGIVVGVVLLLLCCCCCIALILITQWENISHSLGL